MEMVSIYAPNRVCSQEGTPKDVVPCTVYCVILPFEPIPSIG